MLHLYFAYRVTDLPTADRLVAWYLSHWQIDVDLLVAPIRDLLGDNHTYEFVDGSLLHAPDPGT